MKIAITRGHEQIVELRKFLFHNAEFLELCFKIWKFNIDDVFYSLYWVYVWIRMNFPTSGVLRFLFFFFFFWCTRFSFLETKCTVYILFMHCLRIVHGTHNYYIQGKKNGSHRTIHTFKNYFTTVFLVFSKIRCIQTYPKWIFFFFFHVNNAKQWTMKTKSTNKICFFLQNDKWIAVGLFCTTKQQYMVSCGNFNLNNENCCGIPKKLSHGRWWEYSPRAVDVYCLQLQEQAS